MIWSSEQSDRQQQSAKNSKPLIRILVIVSFIVSLAILFMAGFENAFAQDQAEASREVNEKDKAETRRAAKQALLKGTPIGPLVIPVYPRGTPTKDAPVSHDLRDSYVVMQDGSVLSVADWLLGSLNKDKLGAGMSDYENRLFLGQVARAMVGMDENMVNNSLVNTAPTVSYRPGAPIPVAAQVLYTVISLPFPNLINYDPTIGPNPATVLGRRTPTNETQTTVLFDRQFSNALAQANAHHREDGIVLKMLDKQRKKLAKERTGN